MELSFFLAKLIGLYLIIVALIWLFRKNELEATSKEVLKGSALLAVTGVFSLVIGLAIVIDHSIWDTSWRVLITVIGYLAIVQGVLRLAFPQQYKMMAQKMLSHRYLIIAILLVVGVFLTYKGFML